MCAKFGTVMEKIPVNQVKKRAAPQLGHPPQKGNIRYIINYFDTVVSTLG